MYQLYVMSIYPMCSFWIRKANININLLARKFCEHIFQTFQENRMERLAVYLNLQEAIKAVTHCVVKYAWP